MLKLIETKRIIGVDLSGEKLEKIDFTGCILKRVNFKGCEMVHCRFRNANISWSDFRYAEIHHGTFEGAQIDFCDFYRAFIDGVVIFNGSSFSNCSLNKTYLHKLLVRPVLWLWRKYDKDDFYLHFHFGKQNQKPVKRKKLSTKTALFLHIRF